MADWTDTVPAPFGVNYFNSWNSINSIGAATGSLGTPASATYPAANRAIFIPFRLMTSARISKLWAYNGATLSGNFDLGIYDAGGVRLASIGSTAQSDGVVNTIRIVALASALRLALGLYYIAIAHNDGIGTYFRVAVGTFHCNIAGMAQMTSAFPLPAIATFTTVISAYLPVIGFISEEG